MSSESSLRKFQQHLAESRRIYRQCGSLRSSIYRFSAASLTTLLLFGIFLYYAAGPRISLEASLWTLAFMAAYFIFVFANLPLLRDPGGARRASFGAANILTSLRLFAVPPVLVLLLEGRVMMASAIYVIAVMTDVIDGYVARRYDGETLFGVMVDPVADILITMALFLFLWLCGDIPLWLFIILAFRYTQFFAGLFLLAVMDSVPRLHATAAGKVVGIVQAIGIVLLMAGRVVGTHWPSGIYRTLIYIALGAAFTSVIVSQTVIGLRAIGGERQTRR